jgi:hypothetical protein
MPTDPEHVSPEHIEMYLDDLRERTSPGTFAWSDDVA